MSDVVIKFNNLNQTCINKILREKLGYVTYPFREVNKTFCFDGHHFLRMFGDCSSIDREAQRFAFEIGLYDFVSNVRFSYDCEFDRYIIVVIGETDERNYIGGCVYEGWNQTISTDPLRNYFENDRKAVLDAYKRDIMHLRIPKTFDVYSGYSRDGRLRTVVHWQDGVKTDVYLQNEDFDDIYLAIAYCYVKRKFGNLSHFKKIVDNNTKEVTTNVKRFCYGGDSTLLVNMYSKYDQVALYLAISYLGDTEQWLTEEDKERLEDSVSE